VSETLAEALTYYDSLLAFSRRYLRIPAIQTAVYADDGIAFSGAYGLADVAAGVELTERHLFRIASHSKTFTATAVLQLVERGKLRLDDRAVDHVTELAGHATGDVTVRELLGHTSGITRDSRDSDFWQLGADFPDHERLLEILREDGAGVIPPNDRFKYSNIGYGLLGLIVEAATGTSYGDYVRKEIVERLGLADLGPELDPERLNEYAAGYSALSYAEERVPIEHVDTRGLAAATGFYGSARDLAAYFSAHLPGDERLLTDASKRQMQHPQWQVKPDDAEQRYGLGLGISKIGERDAFGHGGGYPGHSTRSLVDPERRIVVSVLTSAIDGPAQQLAVAFLKLLDLAESKDRPADGTDLHRFTGRFASLWGVVDIALLGGRLYALDPCLADPSAEAVPLEPAGESALRSMGGTGYGAYGECYEYEFDGDRLLSLRAPGGLSLSPFEGYSLPDRVTVQR